jgi:hypothetical protein
MKQLAIFCSTDIEEEVTGALDHAGVEGFLRVAGGAGTQFAPKGELPRSFSWEATVFIVPALAAEPLEEVVSALSAYAGSCTIEPCLRIVVSDVERVL